MKKIIILGVILFFASCSTQTFTLAPGGGIPAEDNAQHFFVAGIGQQKEVNASEVCGGADNVIKVEVQLTFLNIFLTLITYGIYSPRQARVYCSN